MTGRNPVCSLTEDKQLPSATAVCSRHASRSKGHLRLELPDNRYEYHLQFDKADLALDYTQGFEMKLPDNEMFDGFDLTIDQSEDIKEVETGE